MAAARHLQCSTCGSLGDEEYAVQTNGRPEYDTHLPPAADRLRIVRDYEPHGGRQKQLRQCPECGTYYLYRTDYEFQVGGSEDYEYLTRLGDEVRWEQPDG